MADKCENKRDRIAQSDMQHKEKQQRLMETIRAEMYPKEQESTSSNATKPTSSQALSRATSPTTSRATSPSPMRKISRRQRVDENLQDISGRMQQMGQVLTAATSALLKNMKPDKKYRKQMALRTTHRMTTHMEWNEKGEKGILRIQETTQHGTTS
jgi:hypothetical protein